MVYEFRFADIGEGVHEGEILQWHVTEGDQVKQEQLLVEIITEKVTVEITAPVAGTVLSLENRKEGDIVKVGEVLVKIDDVDVPKSKTKKVPKKEPSKAETKDDSLFTAAVPFKRTQPMKTQTRVVTEHPLAAPSIRREAREKDIDLRYIQGSGSGGRITRSDLEAYLKAGGVPSAVSKDVEAFKPREDQRVPLRGLRRNIAKAMRKSKDTAAHYTYFEEVDMSILEDLRQKAKSLAEKYETRLTYIPLIIKCLIPALREFPQFNAQLDDESEEIVLKGELNIGIAVNTDNGLIVPVIKNADRKNVWELAKEVKRLADKARAGKLTLDEVTGGTFTITSTGNIGGVMATPIIRWPEVAILGVFRSKLRPVVIENNGSPEIGIRPVMYIALTLDHRVVDGAVGAMFTNTLIRYMENPALLLLDEI
ncbi:MAG: dihydrolipoamide acetyltransferase family protein [Candidatus Heimdallarchaeota archaeon]